MAVSSVSARTWQGALGRQAPASQAVVCAVPRFSGLRAVPTHKISGLGACRQWKTGSGYRLKVTAAGEEGKSTERKPWDFSRFLQTVLYFNPPPSPAQLLESLGGMFRGQQKTELAAAAGGDGVVLVTGATGGVGKRVVDLLRRQGIPVRALARDVDKAKKLLGGEAPGFQIVAADITQPQTLTPEMFQGVRAIVSATAVTVAPKEGDTQDRAKYYQGIKFYDPEIKGDTPETVEYKGIKNVLDVVGSKLGQRSGKTIFAVGNDGKVVGSEWGALDDVVMGGVSKSGFQIYATGGESGGGVGVFAGQVSTDNNGGFVSVRTKNYNPPLDLSAYDAIELRLKGTGNRFKFIIRADSNWDGISYCKSFDTVKGEWQTIRLPLKDFFPVFRAKTLKDGKPLDASSIYSIQLMLSKFEYDGALNPAFTAGAVTLPVESIRGVIDEPIKPRFVHVSSASVTRPNRPGIKIEEEPPAVRLNDALGGLLTWKLAGEDAIRDSGIPFAIVRPCALTEEPGGMPLKFDQGDNVRGKVSRDDIAALCVALLNEPLGLDKTFEVTSQVPFSQQWEGAEQTGKQRDWKPFLEPLKENITGKELLVDA